MSATTADHPTDETLRSHGLGSLDQGSAESVDKHLEVCADCQRRVAAMASDIALGRLREAPGQSGSTGHCVSSLDGLSMLDDGAGRKPPPPAGSLPPGLADHPDYEVIRELGHGGMGTVYLALNRLMGRHEVLKVVSKHMMNRPGALERFLSEIRHAARLHHTNIVTAYSATRVGESIVFGMEYVEGLDLSRLVKAKGPLPVSNACNYIHQAALGLQHASELGLVHRDIKPGNLMLARQGGRALIKVLDFGLAKVKSEGAGEGLTGEGQLLGTPEYVAPEQISDARHADMRADIYSLGCTLYCLLTGSPPFQAASLYDLLQAHHSMDALPLNLARPAVPIELAALVAKMMAKEPERRFQTPKEVAQALRPFFKPGPAGIAESNAEMPGPGRADENRASTPALSIPARPELPTTPVGSPLPEAPASTSHTEPVWEGVIKFKDTRTSREAEKTLAAPSRLPRWLPPATVVGLLVLSFIVARTTIPGFKTVSTAVVSEKVDTRATAPTGEPVGRSADVPSDGKTPARKETDDDRLTTSAPEPRVISERPLDRPEDTGEKPGELDSAVDLPTKARLLDAAIPPTHVTTDSRKADLSRTLAKTFPKADFQPLFNGKDLTGWKPNPRQPDNWHVVNHVLIGSGPSISHLYTERDDFKDFHLRIEARFNRGGHSGVFFRSPFGPRTPAKDPKWPEGLEATINNARIVRNSTGGIYPGVGDKVFINDFTTVPPEQWFTMEVVAYGNAIAVRVNGKLSGYLRADPRGYSNGHIALQKYSPGTQVEFRKIEIKELDHAAASDPKEIRRLRGYPDPVTRVAFSPDGRGILFGGNAMKKWRIPGGGEFLHFDHGYDLRFWATATGEELFSRHGDGWIAKALAFSADGRYAASAENSLSEQPVLVWDLASGKRIHNFRPSDRKHNYLCSTLSFSSDDHQVMAASTNGSVRTWDLSTGQELPLITLKAGPIKQDEFPIAAFSSNRKNMFTRSRIGATELWDLQTGQRLRMFAGAAGDIGNIACSKDGRYFLSIGSSKTIRLWNVASGKEIKQLTSNDNRIRCVAFSPDSRRALSADIYGLVKLWDLASGTEVCRMEGHSMAVNSVAFSPDGRRAVSGSDDRTVRLWQLPE
jgi:WD40 repeat protein